MQGAHKLLTSLQRDDKVSGNFSVAASRLEIEEPKKEERTNIFFYKTKTGSKLELI